MKHLNTYKIFEAKREKPGTREVSMPDWATRIDISKLKLIDPFDLSYFEDIEDSIYFYDDSKIKSYSYDDNWSWTELWTLEDDNRFKIKCGYIIFKSNKPLYVVGIYGPKGLVPSTANVASQIGGLVTILGHETIINLWLDYDEYDATRIDAL